MFNYFLVYNDKTNLDVMARIEARPSKPAPQLEIEEVFIPGASKTLYREKGYKPIEIEVSMNFIAKNPSEWDNHWRKIKKWLLSKGSQKLQFSDDLEGYYKVEYVIIDTPERIVRKGGSFQCTFVCDPFFYINTEEELLTSSIYNDFDLDSRPIYRIVGNGELTLKVNSKTIKVNVGQETTINCDLGLCYRDGVINNSSLTGNYEDLYLKPGENTFALTPTTGFSVFVQPNWRCL